MPKQTEIPNVFDVITGWEHHPKVIVALGYLSSLFFIFPADNINILGVFMSVVIIGSLAVVVLFIPYLIAMLVVAALLSMLQAIATALHLFNEKNL